MVHEGRELSSFDVTKVSIERYALSTSLCQNGTPYAMTCWVLFSAGPLAPGPHSGVERRNLIQYACCAVENVEHFATPLALLPHVRALIENLHGRIHMSDGRSSAEGRHGWGA